MQTNSGVSPATGRTCDNEKQLVVIISGWLNLLLTGIFMQRNLGNLVVPKKAEFIIKRIKKLAIKNTFWG